MRNPIFPGLAAIALAAAAAISAQQPPAAPFQTHQLTRNIYWVEGGGGNSGVIVGQHGVIVVDTKTTPQGGKELLDDIAKITSKPVTAAILTHSDVDHIGGLPSFPKGITIIAHANDLKEQQQAMATGGRGAPSPGDLPNKIVTGDKQDLTLEGVKFELLHWAPAHTSGDLVVYLPGPKIVFTGDIVIMTRPRPLIHAEKGGTSAGWIASVKGILALDARTFVPGHGDVTTRQAIETKLHDAEAERNQIKELVAQGKTLPEIEAAVADPPPGQAQGGGSGQHFATYSEVVYRELTKSAP